MPFPAAAGNFQDSRFFACFVSAKSYVLLSDGAGDVTEYHVLRRQRSHVFLAHVLRSGRTRTAVRSSEGYVLRSQVNRICVGERRRTLRNVKNEAYERTCRRQGMGDTGLAQLGIFLLKHVFSFGGEEILPQN